MSHTPLWRRPIWILGHVVALTAVVLFVRAGFWQLDRLDQKRDRNRAIAARSDGPPIEVNDVVVADGKYQHVTAHGTFMPDADVLVPYRSYEGNVGAHVVTPFFTDDDGLIVLVNRGWIPDGTTAPPAPEGEVVVEGILLETQDRRRGVAVDDVGAQAGVEPYPLWLSQSAPDPEGDYPILLPPPARDEGPHLSYAIQWFLFTGVVLIGYPILLRRRIRADQAA
jgi:cytochrome oxidase assembly protein ShyY1